MQDWFSAISNGCELPAETLRDLDENGFAVIPGASAGADSSQLAAAYDSAVVAAPADDVRIGSTTTRVAGFVSCGRAEFDRLYLHPPLLAASCRVINQPFKLSALHARTLHPRALSQKLHVDFKPHETPFPLLGFILMIDDFHPDNGATRFVPGSHRWAEVPNELAGEYLAEYESRARTACGRAGSIIVFSGSVWHGHSANTTDAARRSVQGAFIPREACAGTDFRARMSAADLDCLSPLAKYLLAI